MNIRDIDLNLMTALEALLEHRSVSKAARANGVTQPAMSNALGRLRKLLDDPILIRSGQSMQPTEKALSLFGPISVALDQIRTALEPTMPFNPEESKRLFTFACSDTVDVLLFSRILKYLEKHAPSISINSLRIEENTFKKLERGDLDGIIYVFDKNLPTAFYQRRLWEDDFVCVVRKDHPILAEGKGTMMDAYLTYPHIMVTTTGIGKGYADTVLAKEKKQRQVSINVRHTGLTPLTLVLNTNLIATSPRSIANEMAGYLPITLFESPIAMPSFTVSMAWNPLSHHNQGHRWFRELIFRISGQLFEDSGPSQ